MNNYLAISIVIINPTILMEKKQNNLTKLFCFFPDYVVEKNSAKTK